MRLKINIIAVVLLSALVLAQSQGPIRYERRNSVSYRRGPYNFDFWRRHNEPYRFGSAIHFAHAKQHDILQLTPIAMAKRWDNEFDSECLAWVYDLPKLEPHMMYWGPYTGQFAWHLYRAIDWTHMHHEQTYDVMSSWDIPWDRKKEFTDKTVEYYLKHDRLARSIAPLDITMRRAGTMTKPYFTLFRNKYPKSNTFFFVAHWWHPVIYEAMMIAGNDQEQETSVWQTHSLLYEQVFEQRPLRMLLSREIMPRYSMMSPESANIFDNLHMLHGIAYDILAYEGWTESQKRAELYRVIDAMAYQPGDEKYVRKFDIPHPDMDPRIYYDWLKTYEGSMNRIMEEMWQEMWPHMADSNTVPENVMNQLRMKLTPGMQEGEIEGSFSQAMMKVYPKMKMKPESKEPGVEPTMMVNAMLKGWEKKYSNMEPVPGIDMTSDPKLQPLKQEKAR